MKDEMDGLELKLDENGNEQLFKIQDFLILILIS